MNPRRELTTSNPILENGVHWSKGAGISSSHFLRLVEDIGTIGFWSSTLDDDEMRCSPGMCLLLDIDPTRPFRFRDLQSRIHVDDQLENEDLYTALIAGQPTARQFRIVRWNRTVRYMKWRAEVVLGPGDVPLRAMGIILDITDQNEMVHTSKQASDRLKGIVAAIDAIEWRADANGEPRWEPAWGDLTAQTKNEADNGGWLDAIHPDDRARVGEAWRDACLQTRTFAVSYRVRSPSGYCPVFGRAVPIVDSAGKVREWIGVTIKAEHLLKTQLAYTREDSLRLLPNHLRAARGALDWSLSDLSKATGVPLATLRRLEGDRSRTVRTKTAEVVLRALEEAGINFSRCVTGPISILMTIPL